MKISVLIKELEEIKSSHGDLPIIVSTKINYGSTENILSRVSKTSFYGGKEIQENLDEDEIKEIFPEYDGTWESLDNDFDCILLYSGSQIFKE